MNDPLTALAPYIDPAWRDPRYEAASRLVDAAVRGTDPAPVDAAMFADPADAVRVLLARLRFPSADDMAAVRWAFPALLALVRGDEPQDVAPTPAPEPEREPNDGDDGPCNSCTPAEHVGGRALTVCTTPGCGCHVPRGKCDGCRRAHDRGRNRTAHRRAYRSREWTRKRVEYLRAHPYCECDECMKQPALLRPRATVVDHVDGLGPLGPRGLDDSNLRAMTKAHHDARTMRDQVRDLNDGS